jgi:phosphotransferase system enzyme I (PtsI)
MFPMVSGVDEFLQAKEGFDECVAEVREQGVEVPKIPLGVMVEMPSAAITADLLAKEVDFFSVGTNDLTQYALAIDRVNENVNYLFKPYHPAILRLIQHVVQAAESAHIPVTVCGEMASDPLMTLVLVGLGVRRLSMSALAVPTIKQVVRGATAVSALGLATKVLAARTSQEVETEVLAAMRELFPDERFVPADELDDDTIV